jgi:hypothetical protein
MTEWIYRFELAPQELAAPGRQSSRGLLRFARLQIGALVASPPAADPPALALSLSGFRLEIAAAGQSGWLGQSPSEDSGNSVSVKGIESGLGDLAGIDHGKIED